MFKLLIVLQCITGFVYGSDFVSQSDMLKALKANSHVIVDSAPPVTINTSNLSTSAYQITGNSLLTDIKSNQTNGTQRVIGTFYQATQPVSGTFYQAVQPVSMTVAPPQGPISSVMTTTASVLLVSQQVLAQNLLRKGLIVYNNSTNSVYIAFDSTASSATHMTAIIPTFAQWIAPTPCYTGPIAAIRNAGNGALFITELQ